MFIYVSTYIYIYIYIERYIQGAGPAFRRSWTCTQTQT